MGFGFFFLGWAAATRSRSMTPSGSACSSRPTSRRPTSQVPAGVTRTPVQNCSMARWSMFSTLPTVLSPGLAPPISNLALVRIQMKPRGIAPATSRAAASRGMGGEGRAIGASVQE